MTTEGRGGGVLLSSDVNDDGRRPELCIEIN